MCSRHLYLCLILMVVFSLGACFGETDLVTNGGFENGTDGWMARGCQIEAVSEPVHSGSGSVKVSGRDSTWQGVQQSMLGKMEDGEFYQISGWVRLDNSDSNNVILSVEQADDSGTHYTNVGRAMATNSEWVEVSGEFMLDVDGELSTLAVYFEGPEPGVNFYVDDVKVLAPDDDDSEDEDMDDEDDANDVNDMDDD